MKANTGFYQNYVAFMTLMTKEVQRFIRIWPQSLLPPAITMSLYFIIFGKFVGSQIRQIEGYTYIQFIVPGLVLMSVMTNAYTNSAFSFFITKFNRSIEEMIVSPMSNFVILVGYTISGALRGLLVGSIVLIISFLFTHVPMMHPFIIFSMALLTSIVFSLAGLLNGIYAKKFDDISLIPTFVLTPLTYLGGVFYSLKQLSPFWQKISVLNPVFDMVDTFRFGMLGVSDLNIAIGFSLVTVFFLLIFFWGWYLLKVGKGIKV